MPHARCCLQARGVDLQAVAKPRLLADLWVVSLGGLPAKCYLIQRQAQAPPRRAARALHWRTGMCGGRDTHSRAATHVQPGAARWGEGACCSSTPPRPAGVDQASALLPPPPPLPQEEDGAGGGGRTRQGDDDPQPGVQSQHGAAHPRGGERLGSGGCLGPGGSWGAAGAGGAVGFGRAAVGGGSGPTATGCRSIGVVGRGGGRGEGREGRAPTPTACCMLRLLSGIACPACRLQGRAWRMGGDGGPSDITIKQLQVSCWRPAGGGLALACLQAHLCGWGCQQARCLRGWGAPGSPAASHSLCASHGAAA